MRLGLEPEGLGDELIKIGLLLLPLLPATLSLLDSPPDRCACCCTASEAVGVELYM
jgi:hypothetical protein